MKVLTIILSLTGMCLLSTSQALASKQCSTQAMAGQWVYASSVGQVLSPELIPTPISSMGTVNVDRHGSVTGKFDATLLGVLFFPGVTYVGTLTINPDCTGTFYFLQDNGFERTDSVVVVSRSEMFGMSQDPQSVFTYQIRRISSKPINDDDSDSG